MTSTHAPKAMNGTASGTTTRTSARARSGIWSPSELRPRRHARNDRFDGEDGRDDEHRLARERGGREQQRCPSRTPSFPRRDTGGAQTQRE